jgi:hypothetical protein
MMIKRAPQLGILATVVVLFGDVCPGNSGIQPFEAGIGCLNPRASARQRQNGIAPAITCARNRNDQTG